MEQTTQINKGPAPVIAPPIKYCLYARKSTEEEDKQILSIDTYNKEFAFTKLMTCGLCGSGVTASEKWKHQQNGNTHRYVYYGCCKHKDRNCSSGYIREDELVEQLADIIDNIDLNEIGIKQKIKDEIERHKRFNTDVLGLKSKSVKSADVDIRNYAKHILRSGMMAEKREMLDCLKSKITLANKRISLA